MRHLELQDLNIWAGSLADNAAAGGISDRYKRKEGRQEIYENLEAKRVMDLDNPPKTIWPTEDYFVTDEGTGKYICSVCGYVYDPEEHDGIAFDDLPDDWKCPRCKQPKEKFNKA